MANYETIQVPIIPLYEYRPNLTAVPTLPVLGTSRFRFPPNHRIVIGTKQYRSDPAGLVDLTTADAVILSAKLAILPRTIPGVFVIAGV